MSQRADTLQGHLLRMIEVWRAFGRGGKVEIPADVDHQLERLAELLSDPEQLVLAAAAISVLKGPEQSPAAIDRTVRQGDADDAIWLTSDAATGLTGLSRSTIDRAIRHGDLRSVKVGRSRRIHRTALDEFMQRKDTR